MLYEPPMTEKQARKFIEENIDIKIDFKVIDSLLSKKESESWLFLYNNEDKKFHNMTDKKMPIILNKLELDALKMTVDMEMAEGFLEQDTIEKLKKLLENRDTSWDRKNIKYKRQYSDGDKNHIDSVNSKLKILLKAIRKKCAVKCDNITRKNITYKEQVVFPLKIEYSTINDKFRLYCFKERKNEKEYIKMNISSIKNLEIQENTIRQNDEEFIESNIKNTKKVTLYVDSETHVIERCFRLFSFYDREAIYDRENDIYILEINYYIYDESDVIKNILSLGSKVIVKSPEEIKQKILSRVKIAMDNYNNKS